MAGMTVIASRSPFTWLISLLSCTSFWVHSVTFTTTTRSTRRSPSRSAAITVAGAPGSSRLQDLKLNPGGPEAAQAGMPAASATRAASAARDSSGGRRGDIAEAREDQEEPNEKGEEDNERKEETARLRQGRSVAATERPLAHCIIPGSTRRPRRCYLARSSAGAAFPREGTARNSYPTQ